MCAVTDASPYVCITADTHAGASLDAYGTYLEPRYRDEFVAWRERYRNPHKKHLGGKKTKNWDSAERLADLEASRTPCRPARPRAEPDQRRGWIA